MQVCSDDNPFIVKDGASPEEIEILERGGVIGIDASEPFPELGMGFISWRQEGFEDRRMMGGKGRVSIDYIGPVERRRERGDKRRSAIRL
jgi:hypothetical protein